MKSTQAQALKQNQEPLEANTGVFVHALRSILQSVPERTQAILEARFGISHQKPKTLEEIGKEYGITRERVRQIICSALHALVKHHENQTEGNHVEKIIQEEIQKHSGVVEAETLLQNLSKGKKEERGALTAFLECLPYAQSQKQNEEHEKMYHNETFSKKKWQKVLSVAEDILKSSEKTLSRKKLFQEFLAKASEEVRITEKQFFNYLEVSRKIQSNVFDKWGLQEWSDIRPRGTREKAFLILKHEKKPLHFRDIAKRIDEAGLHTKRSKSHPQTVHNELIKDDRFVLVGRGIYALSEWGYTAGTVKDVIERILSKKGVPQTKDEIMEAVLAERQVKPTTITINLNTFFHKNAEGHYVGLSKKKK